MSLLDSVGGLASADQPVIALDAERCLHSLDRSATCEACYAICPAGAIAPGGPPTLDAGKCEACLACLAVCPTGAYRAEDAAPALVRTAPFVEGRTVELLCAKNSQAATGVLDSTGIRVRGCLAGLGVGTYLALSVFGLEHIIVRTDACSGCPWESLHPRIDVQVARAQHLLSIWERSELISCKAILENGVERPLWNAGIPPLSRRDLFRMLVRQGQVAVADAIESEPDQPERLPGRDRLRLLNALAHLPAPDPRPDIGLNELDFAFVTVTEACTACGACAHACPAGALQFIKHEDDTTYALRFSARLCTGCDLCAHVCFSSAISVDHTPTYRRVFGAETVVLRAGALIRCKRCGTLMAKHDDVEVCALCEYRRAHPFGSMLPPGFEDSKLGAARGNQ